MSWTPPQPTDFVVITVRVPADVARSLASTATRIDAIKPEGFALTPEAVVLMVGVLATSDLADEGLLESILTGDEPK